MRQVKTAFFTVVVLSVAIWIAANLSMPHDTFYDWRAALTNLTGILATVAMATAMVLSLRPRWAEHAVGGLDKVYRLHKWLGISAGIFAILHWSVIKSPKLLLGLGLIEKRVRGPRPVPSGMWDQMTMALRHSAEEVGEWALYGMLALIAVALVKQFPYRAFFNTHRLMAVVFGIVAYHSLILMEKADWLQPLGVVVAVLLIAGLVAAVLSLTRRIGQKRKTTAVVEAVEMAGEGSVMALTLRFDGRWPGHEAGQFAFLTLHEREGAHPFTISSAWSGDGRIRFLIKRLGDYTASLPRGLQVGDRVSVEGPYGRFTFAGRAERQIWIAGGIGITPFLARLEALAAAPQGRPVDLFYATASYDPVFAGELEALAGRAGVRLHVADTVKQGYLTGAKIGEMVPQFREADVWFCGPQAFGAAVRDDLAAQGADSGRFHQELFDMR